MRQLTFVLFTILLSCSPDIIHVNKIYINKENDVKNNYTEEVKLEMRKFGGIIYSNKTNTATISQQNIAQALKIANLSCKRIFSAEECFNEYDLVFVNEKDWERFTSKFYGPISPSGWCAQDYIVIKISKKTTETVSIINHERVHCSFNSHNEIASQFGEYLMGVDEALRTNNIDLFQYYEKQMIHGPSGKYHFDRLYLYNYLHQYKQHYGIYPSMKEAFYAVTDVDKDASVDNIPDIPEAELIQEFITYRANFYASIENKVRHFCPYDGSVCIIDLLTRTPKEAAILEISRTYDQILNLNFSTVIPGSHMLVCSIKDQNQEWIENAPLWGSPHGVSYATIQLSSYDQDEDVFVKKPFDGQIPLDITCSIRDTQRDAVLYLSEYFERIEINNAYTATMLDGSETFSVQSSVIDNSFICPSLTRTVNELLQIKTEFSFNIHSGSITPMCK